MFQLSPAQTRSCNESGTLLHRTNTKSS
ncbi:hypothetical protein CcCBS67573_g05701 [Chytriomyces confervae]|uniref:Uncharacterized protein n=1 Tax=Chytriomyces confervae TaxID=246404 RepID=A0A507F9M4_9FUNG|nr:hypothetical protein CcCBS67573_g05701 [Chytriomyces confervae]